MRGDQLARQWRILVFLSNSMLGRRLSQISEEAECSERNARRDLDALMAAGFPIYTDKVGQTTVWKMSETLSSNPPIPLTTSEMIALLLAETELCNSSPDDFITESFCQVTEKIRKSRPPEFRELMELLKERFYGGRLPAGKGSSAADRDIYEEISQAIAHNQKVSVTYQNAAGEKSSRKLAPLHLWVVNNSRYLVAYCYQKKQVRTFHMKRFKKAQMLNERFENEWTFDIHKHAEETFGVFHAQPESITIWFDPILCQYMKDHPLHPQQRIVEQENGFTVKLRVGINESLLSRIVGFGAMARVLSPDRLAILVMEKHRTAYEAYQAPLPVSGGASLPLVFE